MLRPGAPAAAATWPGDDDPRAVHLAVRDAGRVVAVASVLPAGHPDEPREGDWRIRGMATAPGHRGRGHGAALVTASVTAARAGGAHRVWCNARLGAVSLYERAGFAARGGVFEEPGLGPHVRLELTLGRAA